MAAALLLCAALVSCGALTASPAAARLRSRPVDRLPRDVLFPSDMSPATRMRHRAVMASWKAPTEPAASASGVVSPIDFGADPTGVKDSTAAFTAAMAAVMAHNTSGHSLSDGIVDLGGVVLDLQGGDYLLSAPLVVPQYAGNMRIIDGTLRASKTFPPSSYVVEVCFPTVKCSPPSGQGSCCENVGMSGLTIDASHIATGSLRISNTMGATLDASSAIFGFTTNGIAIAGGHETMISETWVAVSGVSPTYYSAMCTYRRAFHVAICDACTSH